MTHEKWLKCIPIFGTTLSFCETCEALYEGNGEKAFWKFAETVVGVGMDALTIASAGTTAIATASAKTAGKIVVSEAVKDVVKVLASEAAKDMVKVAVSEAAKKVVKVLESNSAKNVVKVAVSGDAIDVADATVFRAIGTTVTEKVADNCRKSNDGSNGGDCNDAEGGKKMRQAAIDAQNEWKEQKQKERDVEKREAQTGDGGRDPKEPPKWDHPECEGAKLDDDDVVTDEDKTKAMLNKNLPEGVTTVTLLNDDPIDGPINGPITQVLSDEHKIVHYSWSVVTKDNLSTGKNVTKRFKNIIKKIGIKTIKGPQRDAKGRFSKSIKNRGIKTSKGKRGDDAGHILPKVLGGGLEYNLFPQNPAVNQSFHHHVVQPLVDFLKKHDNGKVEYQVRLIYNPGETRPYGFYVLAKCYLDGEVYMDFNNKKGYYFGWWPNPHPDVVDY